MRYLSGASTSAKETASRLVECASEQGEGGLDAIFGKLDTDGNGLIDSAELRTGLERAGLKITDPALQKLMRTYASKQQMLKISDLHSLLDCVADHRFHSFDESDEPKAPAAPAAPASTPIGVKQQHYVFDKTKPGHFEGAIEGMFAACDENGDGVLQPEEIQNALEKMGIAVCDEKLANIFTLYDANGDGVLQLGEFANMVDSLQKDSVAK